MTSLYSQARPISYPEGFTLMSHSDIYKDSVYFHYSPSFKYSVGLEIAKDEVQEFVKNQPFDFEQITRDSQAYNELLFRE